MELSASWNDGRSSCGQRFRETCRPTMPHLYRRATSGLIDYCLSSATCAITLSGRMRNT